MAEKYQRIFYLMYEMKASDSTIFKNDLLHVETFNLDSWPYYAHQNEKPGICTRGFGLSDNYYCKARNIEYQPVIFAGFGWSNWNGGTRNQIPRNRGELMWQQVYNIKNSGIKNMYVAMFDEYDEATAIAKAAV